MDLGPKLLSGIPVFSLRLPSATQAQAKGVNTHPDPPPTHTHTHTQFQSTHLLALATNGLHQRRRVLHFPGEVTTSISFHQPRPPRDHFTDISFPPESTHAKRQDVPAEGTAARPMGGERWLDRRAGSRLVPSTADGFLQDIAVSSVSVLQACKNERRSSGPWTR